MKIKTPFFLIEIEWLLVLAILISFLIPKISALLNSFFVCYLFIVFHELSHMFVGTIFGKNIEKFKFSLCGVNIKFEKKKYVTKKEKKEKIKDILIYLAGPLSNVILAAIFFKNPMIFQVNIFLAFINILPVYPLDGFVIIEKALECSKLIIKKEKILDILGMLIMIFLLIISIYQVIFALNPSSFAFLIYLYVIRNEKKRTLKIDKLLQRVSY